MTKLNHVNPEHGSVVLSRTHVLYPKPFWQKHAHGVRTEKKAAARAITGRTVCSSEATERSNAGNMPQSHCNVTRRWRWETYLPESESISCAIPTVSEAFGNPCHRRWQLCHHAVHEFACACASQGKRMCLIQSHVT